MKRPLAPFLVLLAACGPEDEPKGAGGPAFTEVPCTPDQPSPYPSGLPYVGIHANAEGNDRVRCDTHDAFAEAWHALEGHAVMQPAILSPDGATIYVTATSPEPDGCTLFALDVDDGSEKWCVTLPFDVVASAPEVDQDGRIYLSAGGEIHAFDADGSELWSQVLWPEDRPPEDELARHTGYGVHFDGGLVVTVTASGRVVALNRESGAFNYTVDIPSTFGLVSPPEGALSGFDLVTLLPQAVTDDIALIFGEDRAGDALGSFFGAGTNFSDNTIATHEGAYYVVGGGPTEDSGALVQVYEQRVGDQGYFEDRGWWVRTRPGSAATPSISADGRWVVTSDGTATRSLMDPDQADAAIVAVDIEACNALAASASGPLYECEPAWEYPLQRGAMPGAPALADDGTVWFWEMSMSMNGDPAARDLIAVNADGVQLEVTLPEGREWTSVITLTDNHVVGATSTITPSDTQLAGIFLPQTSTHELVVLSREDGSLVYSAPIPDDCAATVSVGPDGSLYVGMLGLVSMLSLDDRPTLGLMRFRPVE